VFLWLVLLRPQNVFFVGWGAFFPGLKKKEYFIFSSCVRELLLFSLFFSSLLVCVCGVCLDFDSPVVEERGSKAPATWQRRRRLRGGFLLS